VRRLLASTPMLAGAALLLMGVVTWAILSNAHHARTVVHDRPVVTTPIVSSPLTPLQARRARRSTAARSPDSTRTTTGTSSTSAAAPNAQAPAPRQQRQRSSAPRAPTKTSPTTTTQPAPATQPTSTSTTPRPPADVQAPAPVTVCVKGVGGLNCP
jgi:cytoskeletal protein RodZ